MDILILLQEAVVTQIFMEIVVHIFGIQGMGTIILILYSSKFLFCISNNFSWVLKVICDFSDMDGLLVLGDILDKQRALCTLKTILFAQQILIIGGILIKISNGWIMETYRLHVLHEIKFCWWVWRRILITTSYIEQRQDIGC